MGLAVGRRRAGAGGRVGGSRVARGRRGLGAEPAHLDALDPVHGRVVRRDARSGRRETGAKLTAPSPTVSGAAPSAAGGGELVGRHRDGLAQLRRAALARGEDLPAASVEHGEASSPPAPSPAPGAARASAATVDTAASPVRVGQRAGGRDPDPQPGERPGADPDRDPVDLLPAASRSPRARRRRARATGSHGPVARRGRDRGRARPARPPGGEQPATAVRGVAVSKPSTVAVAAMPVHPPRAARAHRSSTCAPPAWATPRVARASVPARSGHSTNAIRSGASSSSSWRVLVVEPREPVEVEMRDRDAPRPRGRAASVNVGLVTGPPHPERAAGATHERRLAGAEVPRHQHHVPRPQVGRELGAEPRPSRPGPSVRLAAGTAAASPQDEPAAQQQRRRSPRRARWARRCAAARRSPSDRRRAAAGAGVRGGLARSAVARRGLRRRGRRASARASAPAWRRAPPAAAGRRRGPGTARRQATARPLPAGSASPSSTARSVAARRRDGIGAPA